MQVGVTRCGTFPLQLRDFAVPDGDHDAARRVMGEFQPRHMAGLGPILAVAPDTGLPDIAGDRRHGLACGLDVSMENLRLFDRVGEGPCDRHRLVGRRAEIIRADWIAEVSLARLRVHRQAPHLGVVLACDQIAVGTPSGQQGTDLFPGKNVVGDNPKAGSGERMKVRTDHGDRCIFQPLLDAHSQIGQTFGQPVFRRIEGVEVASRTEVTLTSQCRWPRRTSGCRLPRLSRVRSRNRP